jgi:phage replication O-like protein O
MVSAALAAPAKLGGAPVLAGGWTKVPNVLLETLMRCDLGPRSLRVLLYLTRQTAGFHRDSVELSYVDIANATNVGQAKLPAVLRELTSRGFVERTSGNGKKNRFSVTTVSVAAVLGGTAGSVATDLEGAPTATSGGATSCRIGVASEPENANDFLQLPPKIAELKKVSFKETSERNSLSSQPDAWQRYAATLTSKARERADSIFEGLKLRFPGDDESEIAACPDNLRTFGAPDGTPWSEIKSPHGLMESAWPQLRDFFRGKDAAQQQVEAALQTRAREREALEQRAAADDAALGAQARAAHEAFVSTFPNEAAQVATLTQFCPRWVSNPLAEPGRSLAIDAWSRAQGDERS